MLSLSILKYEEFDYSTVQFVKRKHHLGYVYCIAKGHPKADKSHQVLEHIIIMEMHIERFTTRDEHVHHLNGIRDDNRIENLQLLTASEHGRMISIGNTHRRGKHIDTSDRICCICKSPNTTMNRASKRMIERGFTPYPQWHVLEDGNFHCHSCYRRIRRRQLKTGK